MITSFDQLSDNGLGSTKNKQAIWEVGFNNEEDLHKWLINETEYLKGKNRERIEEIKRHIALYKGIQYQTQDSRSSSRDKEESSSKYKQKVVVNHIYDICEQKVSSAVKFKPNIAIVPQNDDMDDIYSAKIAKVVFDNLSDQENFDAKIQGCIRRAIITDESWMFITWNPDKGPELEESKSMEEDEIDLIDFQGNSIKDQFGKKKNFSKKEHGPVNIGDVELEVVGSQKIMLEDKNDIDKANFMIREEPEDIAVLKKRYKGKSDKIQLDENSKMWDYAKGEESQAYNQTYVYYFYHKATREVPEGRFIKYTAKTILENRDLPYEHGEFPCERLIEIEIPEELHGKGSFNNGKHLQAHINNLTSMIMRNQYMAAHPKWFVPFGSVNLDTLGNDLTIVQYRGVQPPALSQANPTGSETYNLRKILIEEMGQIMGVHSVSRGTPPPGIEAGVALQFLAEQEHERQNAFISNVTNFIKKIAEKSISVMAQYYEKDDKRMISLLGSENKSLGKYLDPEHLTKPLAVKIQNVSALPKSIAARTQQIIDLNMQFPGMFSKEQVVDMLELGKVQRFYDQATASVRCAEENFESLIDGQPTPDPEEYEDHVQHWKVFSAKIQEHSFKILKPEINTKIKDHLRAREMIMFDRALKIPAFQASLASLTNFPLLFYPESFSQPLPIEGLGGAMPMDGQPLTPPQAAPIGDANMMQSMAQSYGQEQEQIAQENPVLPPM
jgi:hypothetical protein